MHLEKFVWIVMVFALMNLVSCGSPSSSSSSSPAQKQEEVRESEQGLYRAELTGLNGAAHGTMIVKAAGDDFRIKEIMKDTTPGTRHLQFIMEGERCPTEDSNGDGFIDLTETLAQSGRILLPLDGNLESQFEGMNFGPISNEEGTFIFQKSASLSRLMSDLNADDPDVMDEVAKLDGKNLIFTGKVVIVLGSSAELPNTVMPYGENSRGDSLPIACGKISRSDDGNLPE